MQKLNKNKRKSIGIGVIGMGWMGMAHSRSYRNVVERFPDLEVEPKLVACADEVVERGQSAQDRFGFMYSTQNWQRLISDDEIDVITVATPNSRHLEIVTSAVRAGKHVFCEKPVGRTPIETQHMADLSSRAGIISGVGYNYRWSPMVQYAHQLIKEGKLGKVTHYRGRFFSSYASNPNSVLSWRFQKEKAGSGTLGDLMSHVIDMAHFLVGSIDSLVAHKETFIRERPLAVPGVGTHFTVRDNGPKGDVTNEDYVSALVQFENGAQGTLEGCRAIVGPKCEMAFEVNGTKGAIRWNFEKMNELEIYLPEESSSHDGYVRLISDASYPFHAAFNPAAATGLGYDDLKLIEAYHFLKAIQTGQPNNPSFRQAVTVAQVQSAIQSSWDNNSWQSVAKIN